LFQGQDAKSGKFTGRVWHFKHLQKMKGLLVLKAVSFLDVKDSPDKKGLSVSMYAAYDPNGIVSRHSLSHRKQEQVGKYLRLTTVKYGDV